MSERPIELREVVRLWWPLAASWLMMGLELPLVNSAIARLPHEETNLAAYGSLVFPLCLVIEAPIIMLLAASTALCRDRASYAHLRRFMVVTATLLTLLHAAIAFTPAFDWIATELFDMEPHLVEPGRLGMALMLPWTGAIAYRRFQQGVLIRFGRPRAVGFGTVVRLVACGGVVAAGLVTRAWSGVVVASVAVAAGVTAEAIFAGVLVRPVLRDDLPERTDAPPWSWSRFGSFYTPLALFAFLGMVMQPIASAAIGRMPRELASLAVWPAVNNLVFMLRSLAFAFNEVVVATIERSGARAVLSRFAWRLGLATSFALGVVALTPLADLWFGFAQGIEAELVALGSSALLFALPFPLAQARMSLYTGALVHAHRTRGVLEAVVVFLSVAGLLFGLGIAYVPWPGVQQAALVLPVAAVVQSLWLRRRASVLDTFGSSAPSLP
ncbi:MAG: hypothetical protein R3F34_06770 [Planctomycetota bacterium]